MGHVLGKLVDVGIAVVAPPGLKFKHVQERRSFLDQAVGKVEKFAVTIVREDKPQILVDHEHAAWHVVQGDPQLGFLHRRPRLGLLQSSDKGSDLVAHDLENPGDIADLVLAVQVRDRLDLARRSEALNHIA